MALLLPAILTIYFLEKNRQKRMLLFYPALALAMLAFLRCGNGIPAGVFVAYAVVLIFQEEDTKNKTSKYSLAASVFCLIILFLMNGNLPSYLNSVTRSESLYGIGRDEMLVMEELSSEENLTGVVAPKKLAPYLQVYDGRLKTPYAYIDEEDGVTLIGNADKLYTEMRKHDFDTEELTSLARQENCNFIVLDNGYHYPSVTLSTYDFEKMDTIGDYDIYQDMR